MRLSAASELQDLGRKMKRICLVLAVAGVQPGCEAASQARSKAAYGNTECNFLVPEDLGAGAASWVGECVKGYAEGTGVVRVAQGQEVHLFAGEVRKGHPTAGFLDTGSPETTGSVVRFEGRRALPTQNRGDVNKGCRIAADGADKAAARYKRAGNAPSAKFYSGWAVQLRHCLDGPGE